ncbi:chrysanthemyl diphosphate synthase [Artemisia annua]|uniref:Chrysanthemyl diphosphate synthase n=1 Tax=Artemisia annua TaxID=35608 RepID=A0A2U1QJH4_ARTAN|nr:chrysanthemyl diphosphate synthase [Artemisia annua]
MNLPLLMITYKCFSLVGSLSSKWASWNGSSHLQTSTRPLVAAGKYVVRYQTPATDSIYSTLTTTMSSELNSEFMHVYDTLKSELVHDPAFVSDDNSCEWVERMIDYNVPGGEMVRAFSVVDSCQLLKGEKMTEDEVFLACALGWCTEWAEFQTVCGQMIDAIATLEGKKDLSKYTMSLTPCNLFLPHSTFNFLNTLPMIACTLLMFGENLDDHVLAKDVLIEIGIYYQVQNDYLDIFGEPNVFGKTGTDIEECKCSWLIVKAMELANEEQKKILNENYGMKDPEKVAKVKELYHTLNLEGAYEDYESNIYAELIKSIEALPSKAVQAVLKSCPGKIYKGHKAHSMPTILRIEFEGKTTLWERLKPMAELETVGNEWASVISFIVCCYFSCWDIFMEKVYDLQQTNHTGCLQNNVDFLFACKSYRWFAKHNIPNGAPLDIIGNERKKARLNGMKFNIKPMLIDINHLLLPQMVIYSEIHFAKGPTSIFTTLRYVTSAILDARYFKVS